MKLFSWFKSLAAAEPKALPAKPFANCYWVRPEKLLAGEYPLVTDAEQSTQRLQELLRVGVTRFIDLTEVGELPSYAEQLPARFADKAIRHQRFAIADHGVPEVSLMQQVLDTIDAALQAGELLYVHCRAGIGRTGTVIGCHCVRHAAADETTQQALQRLNQLWRGCARAEHWLHIPETDEQEQFILSFNEPMVHVVPMTTLAEGSLQARYQGALLGLVLADVLAHATPAVLQDVFAAHDQHRPQLNRLGAMPWGADTAMTWALAESLVHCGAKPADQMQRYLDWHKHGKYNHPLHAAQVPALLVKSLGMWQWKRQALVGSHDPALLDAHPLARATAAVLWSAHEPERCIRAAVDSARTSLQSPLVLDAVRVYASLLCSTLNGLPLRESIEFKHGAAYQALRSLPLKPEVLALIDGGWRQALNQPAGEDVLSILASAIHAVATTQDYVAAVQRAMRDAQVPATVAAVTGALAGAFYGVDQLPLIWRETLAAREALVSLADGLLAASQREPNT